MTFGRPPGIRNEYLSTQPLLAIDIDGDGLDRANSSSDALSPQTQTTSTVCCFLESVYAIYFPKPCRVGNFITDSLFLFPRKLYQIVGSIIDEIYQMNITREYDLEYHTLLERVISVEAKLEAWKANLPHFLRIRTKDEIFQDPVDTSDYSRLSTVLTLRYLSTRTLLHRAILTRFLDPNHQTATTTGQSVFLQTSENISLDLSVSSAVEMIEIHHVMSKIAQQMLTTWWFSLYYGTRTIPCFDMCRKAALADCFD